MGRFVCSSYIKKKKFPVYTAMAVLINFWRPTVDTDAVGERLLIEKEQERVEATLSLIRFDGLVSLFKSRTGRTFVRW